jgi:hypothetical protein
MSAAVAQGDAEAAEFLVREAESQHSGDPNLAPALAKCKDLVTRAKLLEESLETVERDLTEDRFSMALGHFREALCLSRGFPALKAAADEQAARHAKKLLPQNWRVAEALLQEAVTAEPFFKPEPELQKQFRLARHDEMITSAIHKADRAEFDGTLEDARRRLKDLLAAYPSETRLAERLRALDRKPDPVAAPVSTPIQPASKPAVVSVYDPEIAALAAKTKPAYEPIPTATWDSIKNFVSLAATSAMLAVAGILVWQHFSAPSHVSPGRAKSLNHPPQLATAPASRQPEPAGQVPVAAVQTVPPADEEAWQLIKTSDDATAIRSFLTTYPTSSHALRAKLRLAAMEWGALDKTNADDVEAYLRLHPRSPYKSEAQQLLESLRPKATAPASTPAAAAPAIPSDRDAILAAVHAYMASQTEMSGADVSGEPVVDNDRATVQVHTQTADTPAQTLSLIKSDGTWKVQNAPRP